MPDSENGLLTIMMADVVGSVSMHESLGDDEAHRRIRLCQSMMKSIIESSSGRVVEVVGDEIMCLFKHPVSAVEAARAISHRLYQDKENTIGVRIGVHAGPTSFENGHPYGDTVNIAARMVSCARNSQIIISEQAFNLLSDEGKSQAQFFNQVYVKGKQDPYNIYLVPFEAGEKTVMAEVSAKKDHKERRLQPTAFSLRYRDFKKTYHVGSSDVLLGRGEQCALIINSPAVSRVHANLSFHGGKILLSDCSSNGTHIVMAEGRRETDGQDYFVHHDDWYADWHGYISLGESVADNGQNNIYFKCLYQNQ